jgi:hypothetical protein
MGLHLGKIAWDMIPAAMCTLIEMIGKVFYVDLKKTEIAN